MTTERNLLKNFCQLVVCFANFCIALKESSAGRGRPKRVGLQKRLVCDELLAKIGPMCSISQSNLFAARTQASQKHAAERASVYSFVLSSFTGSL